MITFGLLVTAMGLGAGLAYVNSVGREVIEKREASLFRAASDA